MASRKKKAKPVRRPLRQPTMRQAGHGKTVANEALLAMTDSEWRILSPHLRYLEMPDHLVLHAPHSPLKFLYFPNSGLISLVVFMQDGRTVEAGITGREGMVGLPAMMGFPRHPLQEIVQVSGNAFRISVASFRKLAPRLPELRKHAAVQTMSLGL